MKKIRIKYVAFSICCLLILNLTQAQTYCTIKNRKLCESQLRKMSHNALISDASINEVASEVGKSFMGIPYVAKTLEIEGNEQLVIELSGLDCTTFLENVVTFSRLAKKNTFTFEAFQKELQYVRYRDGEMNEYPSRLHYFSDWIYNNTQKGIIKDITAEIGGKPYEKHINFMSTHRDAYAQLVEDRFWEQIQETEKEINTRKYHYIPKSEVSKLEKGIQSGDLIAITTSIKGLDIVHVGFAYEQNGRIHLMHASTGSKMVEISDKPLADYLMGNKSQSGIMVCRLVNPI